MIPKTKNATNKELSKNNQKKKKLLETKKHDRRSLKINIRVRR